MNLCIKSKCAPLIGTIETTLLGSVAAAAAQLERGDIDAEDFDETDTSLPDKEGEGSGVGGESGSVEVLRFVNEWLSAVADAIVGVVLSQVLAVAELSAMGCAQLLTDLEYLR